jgi:peptidoglycan/LPS O-acetylase OafA/YrhL
MNPPTRFYFLDNLRAFVVILVVVLHGSMTYMAYAPEWWYVLDAQNSLFFTILVLLVDIPIMLVMFFIAGYFAWPSLVKRGPGQFVKDKFIRVGAPWLFGALFLAPPTAYMIYYSRQVPMSLGQFWATDFWSKAFQQSVYWYLGILFFFFILLGLVYAAGGLRGAAPRLSAPTWKLFGAFWAITSVAMLLMYQFFPPDAWFTGWYVLVFQPVRVPLYIGYFILGIYTHWHGWFTADGYKPGLAGWGGLWAVSGLLYLALRLFVMPTVPQPTLLIQAAYAILFNAFCFSSLMAGAALFQQKINGTGTVWGTLAANSYGIYYVHPLILYPLAYIFTFVALPLVLKAPLVIILAILLSWAASAFGLTKVPGVRRAFA